MWDLPTHEHCTFTRNPLDTVICQLRFHPILKVPARIADFQDAVRDRFPLFQESEAQKVDVQLQAVAQAFQVKRERAYMFRSVAGSTTVALASDSISLTEINHRSRGDLLANVQHALEALAEVYAPIATTRLGLRYVNRIDRQEVSEALGRGVEWGDLVKQSFLVQPLAAPGEGTRFYSEVTSTRAPGAMTLRYGLVADGGAQARFRLDVDRFTDLPGDIASIAGQLDAFATDIFSVFREAAGGALIEWMSGGQDAA